MIAKLIVWGKDRDEAVRTMASALDRYEVVGVANNVEFLGRLVRTKSFTTVDLDTALIEREHDALQKPQDPVPHAAWNVAALAEIAHAPSASPPWSTDGFRLGGHAPFVVSLRAGEETREVRATHFSPGRYDLGRVVVRGERVELETDGKTLHATVVPNGARRHVFLNGRRWDLEVFDPLDVGTGHDAAAGSGLRAPMPGKVIAHLVAPGADVKKGTPLMVLEAMKMELSVVASKDGKVVSFKYGVGDQVTEGAELVVFEEAK